MTNELTMPAPGGQELTIREHVAQSTLCHPTWNELDHQHYLISEVGFDPEYVRDHVQAIILQMIETRGAQDARPELPWPC
jgi:hypothetical protein